MRNDVNQPGRARGDPVHVRHRAAAKHCFTCKSRHPHTMAQVAIYLIAAQTFKLILKADTLAQLPHRILFQAFIQLRLAKQHDLHQLAFFRFKIGNQAQHFQAFQRHRLRLIQTHQHSLAFACKIQQRQGQFSEQQVLIDIRIECDTKLASQRQQQAARLQVGVGDIGGDKFGLRAAASNRFVLRAYCRD